MIALTNSVISLTPFFCRKAAMERFTISLDAELAKEFDQLIESRGYQNRSEAVRDLLRRQLDEHRLQRDESPQCIANVSYVYNHQQLDLAGRLARLQHAHHDLIVSSTRAQLDHEHCIETVILRGHTADVRRFAGQLTAERGVRHGALNLVAAEEDTGHIHGYVKSSGSGKAAMQAHRHVHLKPRY
jgi:CopG family nickel-responsive transcriptional regulator